MSKGFNVNIENLDLEKSIAVVKYVGEQRARWGKHYTGDDIGTEKLMDALVILGQALDDKDTGSAELLLKTKRQLTAALAREAKLKKRENTDERS